MQSIKKSIGITAQSTAQLLHKESKENFLAHKTGKYDRVSDQSTKKKKWWEHEVTWYVRSPKRFPEEHRDSKWKF